MTAAAGFLVVPLSIALAAGPITGFITSLPVFFTHTVLSFALCTALVWIVNVIIGVKRWMYPLFGLLWLGGGFAGALNIKPFPWALLLGFPVYAFSGRSYSTLWGQLREGSLPQWVTLFYAGLVLLLMSVVVWWTIRQRFHRQSSVISVFGLVALGITLVGGTGYTMGIMSANAQESENKQFVMSKGADYFTLPAAMPYTVSSYDLTLNLSNFDRPSFSIQMELTNLSDRPLGELVFSLNHQLEVTQVNLPFDRDWDYLRLRPQQPLPPRGTLKVEVIYRGAIWWYGGRIQGTPPQAEAFITPGGINLPCSIAWYPIPGRILVGRERFYPDRQTPDCILAQSSGFTLRVENTNRLHFASNLLTTDNRTFNSNSVTWVHLMAAPELATENVGQVTLIAAQTELDLARFAVRTYYIPNFEYLHQFFPDVSHLNVFAVDAGFGNGFFSLATPGNAGNLTTGGTPYYLRSFAQSPFNEYWVVEQGMVESLMGQGDTPLAENVAYFLHAHRQAQGDAAQIQTILRQGIPQGSAGGGFYTTQPLEERYVIAFALNEIYQQKGLEGLKTLLQQIRANSEKLSAQSQEAVIAWMKEVTNAH